MSRDRLRMLLVAGAFLLSLAASPFLPGDLPASWGIPAAVARWAGRGVTALFLPLAAGAICAIFGRLAAVDPLRTNYDRFRGTYDLVLDAAVVLILGLHATLLAVLLAGTRPWLGYALPLLVGLLIIVVGNALPRIRPNAALGIRTPWTLASERAWATTHRIGGYVVVGFGLFIVVATFVVRRGLGALLGGGAAATVLLLVLVSYLAWRAQTAEKETAAGPR